MPTPENVQGRDLTGLLRGTAVEPRMTFVDGILGATPPYLSVEPSGVVAELGGRRWSLVTQLTPDRAAEDGGLRHFRAGDSRELYLLDDDPGQTHDIAAEHPKIADRLERALLDWYAENEAARAQLGPPGNRLEMLSKAMRDELRALGYAEDESELSVP